MRKVSGIRATLAIQHALDEAGLKRTSIKPGGETNGWVAMQYVRAYGFGVKPTATPGQLDWSIVISGRPHLPYEENTYRHGDDIEISKDPVNPETLYPRIKAVFESIGLNVQKVEYTGHQTMWDDDVSYNIATDHPNWLEDYNPRNSREWLTDDRPRLVCARIVESLRNKIKSFGGLPVYQLSEKVDYHSLLTPKPLLPNSYGLTKGALNSLIDNVQSMAKHSPELDRALAFDGDVLVMNADLNMRIKPVEITNHWGDKVHVYPWPYMNVQIEPKYNSDCVVLVNGEMTRSPDFPTLDGQYEGEGPWSVVPMPNGLKR